ncbi:hypothetical protein TVAGG3_0748450 [Trichomonas vaginalis G3]|uniref:hypothetical protein n=1 Tax=Trichomonas vaginalis (strain ATCC PRA-98 / G3) TaxID=412133 RepID=UPI0021E59310|nr:hypothetical protein TVAGG3_0748450 [Trichomonas vaginalis G3]KAI5512355.1 hypothetical protein TVAGG3_0748450 [Trichomonas vaginalis G3]
MKLPRGTGSESKRVSDKLRGFIPEKTEAWNFLVMRFSSGITQSELRSIANVVCLKCNLKLERDASRDRRILIKWFHDNWNCIHDTVSKIQLLDENEKPINLAREVYEFNG